VWINKFVCKPRTFNCSTDTGDKEMKILSGVPEVQKSQAQKAPYQATFKLGNCGNALQFLNGVEIKQITINKFIKCIK
jgi:hypothetical protein